MDSKFITFTDSEKCCNIISHLDRQVQNPICVLKEVNTKLLLVVLWLICEGTAILPGQHAP